MNLYLRMLRPRHIAAGRPSILVVPLLFVGLAVNCGNSRGEAIGLSDTIQESPFLRPREPFRFSTTLPGHPTGYPDAISSDKYGYLGGNTFFRCGSVRRSRLTPTLGKFVFGPFPTKEALPTKEAKKEATTNSRGYLTGYPASMELRSADGKAIKLKGTRLLFQPHHLETCFEAPGVKMKVDSALDFTDMLEVKVSLAADKPVVLCLNGSFNLPGKWWRQESGIRLGQTVFHYLLGLDVQSNVDLKVTEKKSPIGYRVELAPSKQAELVMRLKPGYRVKDIRDALISQRESSTSVAQRSRKEYHNFFSRIVPPFSCSDQRLVDLYHYIAYAVRFNVVDIPFGPYAHPYLTYSKISFGDDTGLHMFYPNMASDTVFLRWFNDKSFGEQCVRKCLESPGCPPLGPFVSPRKDCIWDYREALVVYEFAKCSDNPKFFDLIKKVVRATAEKPLRRSSLSDCFKGLNARNGWIHQYDGSLRHKPYTKGKVSWDSKMNQKLLHIDINSWRYQLLRLAAAHSRADGDTAAAARLEKQAEVVRETMNGLMWDDKIGFYFDYATKDLKRSDVMSVAAFSVLWAGVPDRSKADRLIKEHLTNPKEFWSQYVLAGTSLADPRTNPRGYTDGGILMDVSNWIPFQGLLRMGYRDVAEELFWRTINTMTSHGMLTWACDHFTADDATPMGGLCPDSGIVADMILRCGTGFVPRTDGLFEFDPLILGPKLESLDWGPYLYKKHWIEVHWRASEGDPKYPAGLTIVIDDTRFHVVQPGHILLRLEKGQLKSVPLMPDPLDVSPNGQRP